jgi:hypothetical protein
MTASNSMTYQQQRVGGEKTASPLMLIACLRSDLPDVRVSHIVLPSLPSLQVKSSLSYGNRWQSKQGTRKGYPYYTPARLAEPGVYSRATRKGSMPFK